MTALSEVQVKELLAVSYIPLILRFSQWAYEFCLIKEEVTDSPCHLLKQCTDSDILLKVWKNYYLLN